MQRIVICSTHGTVSLIKFAYFFVFILSSCSIIEAPNPFDRFQEKNDSAYDIFNNSDNYSGIYLVNDYEYYGFVDYQSNEVEKWIINDSMSFLIKNGKIIKSTGLNYDFEILGYKGFNGFNKSSQALIRFKEPDSGYLEILFSYKDVTDIESDNDLRIIEESFSVPLLGWKGKNKYWFNDKDSLIKSSQILSPFGDKASLLEIKHGK
jgi:hypothetical protein